MCYSENTVVYNRSMFFYNNDLQHIKTIACVLFGVMQVVEEQLRVEKEREAELDMLYQ